MKLNKKYLAIIGCIGTSIILLLGVGWHKWDEEQDSQVILLEEYIETLESEINYLGEAYESLQEGFDIYEEQLGMANEVFNQEWEQALDQVLDDVLNERINEAIQESEPLTANEIENMAYEMDWLKKLVDRGPIEDDEIYIYEMHLLTDEMYPIRKVELDEEGTLETQLQQLMMVLAEEKFENLPIQVKEVREIDGNQIAIIDLKERDGRTLEEAVEAFEKNNEHCWAQNYFQGSYGAWQTLQTIEQTILQPYYQEAWIDGYQLLYNGGTEGWGHIETLGETVYLKN